MDYVMTVYTKVGGKIVLRAMFDPALRSRGRPACRGDGNDHLGQDDPPLVVDIGVRAGLPRAALECRSEARGRPTPHDRTAWETVPVVKVTRWPRVKPSSKRPWPMTSTRWRTHVTLGVGRPATRHGLVAGERSLRPLTARTAAQHGADGQWSRRGRQLGADLRADPWHQVGRTGHHRRTPQRGRRGLIHPATAQLRRGRDQCSTARANGRTESAPASRRVQVASVRVQRESTTSSTSRTGPS